jgi:uncharacterized protein (UPF0333 family)
MGVTINLANGGLGGTLQIADGVCGLVMTGASESGGYTLGTPILVTGMASVTAAGITATYNPFAIRQLQEFYNEAGDGAQLYLMLVSSAVTVASMALNSNANGVVKLLNYAAGTIKVVGIVADDKRIATDGGAITITNGMNADVYTAASNLKTTINGYAAVQQPLRGIIGGTSYASVPANLTNMTTGSNNRVAIVIGNTEVYDSGTYGAAAAYGSAAVGLCLGTIATRKVQQKISRVRSGPLSNTTCYLGTVPVLCTTADINTISGKGFICFAAYAQKSGFFWKSDPMLTATTDDYKFLAYGRVIDKAQIITYRTYLEEVDDDLPLNTDGSETMQPTFVAYLQNLVIQQIEATMKVNGEITSVDCFIDPAQNVVTNSQVNIVVKVRPKGYASNIVISLGFEA